MTTIKKYLYAIVTGVLAFVGAYLYSKGRSDQKDTLTRDNLDAMRKAKDVRDEIHDDVDLASRARQWVRKD